MCRGRGGEEEDQSLSSNPSNSLSNTKKEDNESSVNCELCSSKASLYCQADDAFLCRKCDRWVHGANFLAQRHIRCLLCATCRRLTQRYLIGNSAVVILPTVLRVMEGSECDTDFDTSHPESVKLKQPFLFL